MSSVFVLNLIRHSCLKWLYFKGLRYQRPSGKGLLEFKILHATRQSQACAQTTELIETVEPRLANTHHHHPPRLQKVTAVTVPSKKETPSQRTQMPAEFRGCPLPSRSPAFSGRQSPCSALRAICPLHTCSVWLLTVGSELFPHTHTHGPHAADLVPAWSQWEVVDTLRGKA